MLAQATELLVIFVFFRVDFERKSNRDGRVTLSKRCSEDLVA